MPQDSPLQLLAKKVLARMGIKPGESSVPRTTFYDEVKGNAEDSYIPTNIDEIYLGQGDNPPAGVHLDKSFSTEHVTKLPRGGSFQLKKKFPFVGYEDTPDNNSGATNSYDKLYQEVLKTYPNARFMPKGIFPSNEMSGEDWGKTNPEGYITINSNNVGKNDNNLSDKNKVRTLIHELIHSAQMKNYPNPMNFINAYSKNRDNFEDPAYMGEISGLENVRAARKKR